MSQQKNRQMTIETSTERRVLLQTDWEAYEKIADALGDAPGVRLTYSDGSLEIMTTGHEHEQLRNLLGGFLELFMDETGVSYEAGGAETFRKRAKEKGLEPDECYWIAQHEAMLGVKTWDPKLHPPPDLAVEIEVTHGLVPRLPINAALGVPEVWWYHDSTLEVLVLRQNGYEESAASPALPRLDPRLVSRCLSLSGKLPTSEIRRRYLHDLRESLDKRTPPPTQPPA